MFMFHHVPHATIEHGARIVTARVHDQVELDAVLDNPFVTVIEVDSAPNESIVIGSSHGKRIHIIHYSRVVIDGIVHVDAFDRATVIAKEHSSATLSDYAIGFAYHEAMVYGSNHAKVIHDETATVRTRDKVTTYGPRVNH